MTGGAIAVDLRRRQSDVPGLQPPCIGGDRGFSRKAGWNLQSRRKPFCDV